MELPWSSVQDYKLLGENKRKFVLFHYPIYEWDGYYKGYYHLHGHVHNPAPNFLPWAKAFDVGVDANNYFPVSIEEIIEKEG